MAADAAPSRLAVIIPARNGMPFLPLAIRSILDQTYTDFRLLVVDDGSSDGSAAFAESVADLRLIVLHRQHGGYSRLMNDVVPGLSESLVAVLHQDDVAQPDRLARQVAFLDKHPEYDAVFCQLTMIGANGRSLGLRGVGSGAETDDYDPDRHGSLVHTSACFRRDRFLALGGYRVDIYPAADYDLLLRMSEQGRVAVINCPLVQYRFHAGANTYKVFRRMALMARYARHLHDLRRSGQAEIPLDAYRAARERGPLVRLRNHRIETGRYLYRCAASCMGAGRYARGALLLTLAAAFVPLTVASTLGPYLRTASSARGGRRPGGR